MVGPPLPSPIDWPPSEYWDGDDGSWSTFPVLIGSPTPQLVRVLPSTSSSVTLAVAPVGCEPSNFTASNCNATGVGGRGGLYNHAGSSTASPIGEYGLGLEANLNYPDNNGTYLLDTVGLGFSSSTEKVSLDAQVVATYGANSFYIGMFGLSRQPANFTTLEHSDPSYLTSLRNKNLIPSLSWSYTAGARYRAEDAYGSLTFGGYDASKFVPNNVSFSLASDISRDLVVPIQSISSKNSTGYSSSLLPTPISAYIDSTVPYIYLPMAACELFEQTLGLVYDSSLHLYTVDDGLHQSLLANNTNITLHLGASGTSTVDIEMPYASFDLQGTFPFIVNGSNTTRYFPLRRATNDSQYTLGRTFLQEAYLITNYEASNFSIYQRVFNDNLPSQLVSILTRNETIAISASAPHPRNWKLAVGLGVPLGIVFLLLFAIVFLFIRRRRQPTHIRNSNGGRLITRAVNIELPADLPIAEAVPHKMFGYHEMNGNGKVELANEKISTFGFHEIGDTEKFEMSADKSRTPSGIEVTSTIKVERSESNQSMSGTAGNRTLSDQPSDDSNLVSPVTPVEGRCRNQTFISNQRPPRTATSGSTRSAPSDRSPVSPPTSGHPSLDKSLPPIPTSFGSNQSSRGPSMSETSPGQHSATGIIRPWRPAYDDNHNDMEDEEDEDDRSDSHTPVSDISEGQQSTTRVALPPWGTLPPTTVPPGASCSPITPRSLGSSRSFKTALGSARSLQSGPMSELSPKLQLTTQVTNPAWRRGEHEDEGEVRDEGEPETRSWHVLRSPRFDSRSPRTDSHW